MKNIGFSEAELIRQKRAVAAMSIAADKDYSWNDIRKKGGLHRRYKWYANTARKKKLVAKAKELGLTYTVESDWLFGQRRVGHHQFLLQFFPGTKTKKLVRKPRTATKKKPTTWTDLNYAEIGTIIHIKKRNRNSYVMKGINNRYPNRCQFTAKNGRVVDVHPDNVVKITNKLAKIVWPSLKEIG